MNNTQELIGRLLCGGESRDAIHVAVAPVKVGDAYVQPGQHVGLLTEETNELPFIGKSQNPIGIVDPFLPMFPKRGDDVWLFLYPNTITDMKHTWNHPAFSSQTFKRSYTKEESEQWLREFVEKSNCPSYETLIAAALGDPLHYDQVSYEIEEWDNVSYLHFWGADASGAIPEEFWEHVENATGRKCPMRATHFSCSC